MAKIRNFDSFGGCIPTFLTPINVKFGTGSKPAVRSFVPNFTFIGATCRPCGAKNFFGPLSKNMAALRAGLPVNGVIPTT